MPSWGYQAKHLYVDMLVCFLKNTYTCTYILNSNNAHNIIYLDKFKSVLFCSVHLVDELINTFLF